MVEDMYGNKMNYDTYKRLHNLEGPALITYDGYEYYFIHGEIQNEFWWEGIHPSLVEFIVG